MSKKQLCVYCGKGKVKLEWRISPLANKGIRSQRSGFCTLRVCTTERGGQNETIKKHMREFFPKKLYPFTFNYGNTNNTELNDLRTLFIGEILKFLFKEFQFIMSLKICWNKVYLVCHAPIPMTS